MCVYTMVLKQQIQAPAGYGLTIDIDVLDPSQAPICRYSQSDDGVFVDELAEAIASMPHTGRLLGIRSH